MGMGSFLLDAIFTSPLRGEVDAFASGEGFSAAYGSEVSTSSEPLTPALSPQGRGCAGAAGLVKLETSDGHA